MNCNSYIFQDGMVLQRGKDVEISGDGMDKTDIAVIFQQTEYTSVVESGKWRVTLKNLKAGGPFELCIRTCQETKVYKDILVGDVYLMSGQSNMEIPVQWVYESFKDEIEEDAYPNIRQYKVPITYDFTKPQEDVPKSRWIKAVGSEILDFGATGYFFAKELYRIHQIPIGLIQTAVSGAPIEAFLDKADLNEEDYRSFENEVCQNPGLIKAQQEKEVREYQAWQEELKENDLGFLGKWYECKYDGCDHSSQNDHNQHNDWNDCLIPINIMDPKFRDKSAVVWFYREIELSQNPESDCIINLGLIIEEDITYVNGIYVGSSDNQYARRRYVVPGHILHKGKNHICIRVTVADSVCRFWEKKEYSLVTEHETYDLSGMWKYRYGTVLSHKAPRKTFFEYKPTGVYNAMLAPLITYPVAGVLWYQGEANALNPEGYSDKFIKLILKFRENYEDLTLPFFYVQLANYEEPHDNPPNGCKWAALREEQNKVSYLSNTEMVVAIDVGDATDLHPQDKKTIGYRLSLCARKYIHKENISCNGPSVKSIKQENEKILICFDRPIKIRNGNKNEIKNETENVTKESGFEISDKNGVFYTAEVLVGTGSAEAPEGTDFVELSCKEIQTGGYTQSSNIKFNEIDRKYRYDLEEDNADERLKIHSREQNAGEEIDTSNVKTEVGKEANKVRYLWKNNPEGIILVDNNGLPVAPFTVSYL